MAMELSTIKTLNTVDLEAFEIRGFKYGINNASTTGPAYAQGTYIPERNFLDATVFFDSDSSLVTNFSFSAPYSGLDASSLKVSDTITYDTTAFTVSELASADSFYIDRDSGIDGTKTVELTLIPRDYLVEPDVGNNTFYGTAIFTSGSSDVYGVGTSWVGQLSTSDFIKSDSYQSYLRIETVYDNTHLELSSPYVSDTTTCTYIAKRRKLDRMSVRYTKDLFSYEKDGGFWKVDDSTTDSNILATSTFSSLADGIEAKFTITLKDTDPDIMDSNAVVNKVLSLETPRDLSQFSLPVVPNPESSFELRINDIKKDRFPYGNMDYVISYHQDPVYLPPPPVSLRQVANLMFLSRISNQVPSISDTETGLITFTDTQGNNIPGVMPGSDVISLDGTALQPYYDYVVDGDTGTANVTSPVSDEAIVKYVLVNKSSLIDYGISFSLGGEALRYSIPPRDTDDVRFVLPTGKMKPMSKDHPGPGEEYIIDYYVDSAAVTEEIAVSPSLQTFRLSKYPVKNDSIILVKSGAILDEYDDYRVDYHTGIITLSEALVGTESIEVSYTPLSKQRNGISYDGQSYCTSYGSRARITNVSGFEFSISNYTLSIPDLEVLRINNSTRNADYDLAGIDQGTNYIKIQNNATNQAIGLSETDIVLIDYKFASENTEYYPVSTINLTLPQGSDKLYISGIDCTSTFVSGSVVSLTPSNATKSFYFVVQSSTYANENTEVTFGGTIIEDLVNPGILVSDSSISFNVLSLSASGIVTGSNEVVFDGSNISDLFRSGSLLKIEADIYSVQSSSYDSSKTYVSIMPESLKDYTSSSILSSIGLSDCPVYPEGGTVISASSYIVDDPAQPGLILQYSNAGEVVVYADSSKITLDADSSSYQLYYSVYPTVADMSSAVSSLPGFSAEAVVSSWSSSKFIALSGSSLSSESPVILGLSPELKLDGTDSTSFEVTSGYITLDSGLVEGQRYVLNYQGRRFIPEQQVEYSVSYFTDLPAKSKISASFEYDNLDQFYLQVMSQRYFLENVTEPRMAEEARQNSGNVGQGGEIQGDDAQGNSEGGLVDDEYTRKDTEIECRIFENIFDFFNNRLQSFADERYAALGVKICNNDGLLSKYDESMATKSFNRMWPYADYTNLEPYHITPLTGQTRGPGSAIFENGDKTVTGISGTIWSQQLLIGDYIRPSDSTDDYMISSVVSDSTVILSQVFGGPDSPTSGEEFIITSSYPPYDDDGHMGAKIVGTKSGNFDLEDGDVFDIYIDGSYSSYTFEDPAPIPLIIYLMFRVSRFTRDDIARILTSEIEGLNVTSEWAFDSSASYGFKDVLVLRTDETYNSMILGSGSAVTKLGFTPGDSAIGNLDRSDSSAEIYYDIDEGYHLGLEYGYLSTLITAGISNKLNRISPANITNAYLAYDEITQQAADQTGEIEKLDDEISAMADILQEPELPSYNQTLIAYGDATDYRIETQTALAYSNSILTNWQGKGDATKWVLDYESHTQYIRGVDSTGVGVPSSSGVGITAINGLTTFKMRDDGGYDTRLLNTSSVDGTFRTPIVRNEDDNSLVDGSWTGWLGSVSDQYSSTNIIQFYLNDATPYFSIYQDSTPYNLTYQYSIDGTALSIEYNDGTTTQNVYLPYSTYTTIGTMKTAIDAVPKLAVIGSSLYDSSKCSFKLASGSIVPDATVYPGLRSNYVSYQTISDQILSDRTAFVSDRSSEVNDRYLYLDGTRDEQIIQHIKSEELLRSSDGADGNLYNWADNRFNRSIGCEARLAQIEKQIALKQENLKINKRLL